MRSNSLSECTGNTPQIPNQIPNRVKYITASITRKITYMVPAHSSSMDPNTPKEPFEIHFIICNLMR